MSFLFVDSVSDARPATAGIVRTCDDPDSDVTRHDAVPGVAVGLTGAPLVPDEAFSPRPGDVVAIETDGTATPSNPAAERSRAATGSSRPAAVPRRVP